MRYTGRARGLVFVDHPKYYNTCLQSPASFIIIDREVENRFGKTLLVCAEPFEAYLSIVISSDHLFLLLKISAALL
jgi:hypothetical protein